MPVVKEGIGKGILDPANATGRFEMGRYNPGPDLQPHVEHYWTVSWNLPPGASHEQETLPDPSVHVVFETGRSEVVGVITRSKFVRRIEGAGRVFAIKFRPGGFYPLLCRSVAELNDRRLPVDDVLPLRAESIEQVLSGSESELEMAEVLESRLRVHLPAPDPTLEMVSGVVRVLREDRTMTSVARLCEHVGVPARTLQRTFKRYVGVSPKWLVRRYRLQDAAEELACGEGRTGAELAHDLGYADQSHFVRDFKKLIGVSPSQYAKRNPSETSRLLGRRG